MKMDEIKPLELIKGKHINAGIQAYNAIFGEETGTLTNGGYSKTLKSIVSAPKPLPVSAGYVPMANPFECRADALDPLADGKKICCVGGWVHRASDNYAQKIEAVLFDVPQTIETVWLSIFPDDAMLGTLGLEQASGASIHIKIADLLPDGGTLQHWKSDVLLTAGTGGTAYSFDPLNFNVSGSDVGFKLPTRHLDNTATEHPMQKLQIKAPLTLSGFLENGKTVIELGLDEDYGGGATGYTGEVYIPAYAQDGGSTSHYIAQDFENGLLKRVSNETPVGYPPDWPSA